MRPLIYSVIFLLILCQPLRAEKKVFLNQLFKESQIGFTRLVLDFSSLPSCQVKTHGQRIDLYFSGVDLGPKFRELPEDDAIIRVMLAHRKKELVLSFLLRKVPHKVEMTHVSSRDQLHVDIYWPAEKDGSSVRPAMDGNSRGLPKRVGPGKASMAVRESEYLGKWKEFFRGWQTPQRIDAPVRFSMPELPPLPGRLMDENALEIWKVVHAEGWESVEGLVEMKEKAAPELPLSDSCNILLLESRVRSGKHSAALAEFSEPADADLRYRSLYLKTFSQVALANSYLARDDIGKVLAEMAMDHPLRPYFLLLRAEIELSLQLDQKARKTLSMADAVWTGELDAIRRLRLIDSTPFKDPEKKVATIPVEKVRSRTIPARTAMVAKGDSWWTLSRKYGVSVSELKKLNEISGNLLQIGQQLVISPQKVETILEETNREKDVPPVKRDRNPYAAFLGKPGFFYDKPFSLCRAAGFYEKQGEFDEALHLYERAMGTLPEKEVKIDIELAAARLLEKIGKTSMSLERLNALAERVPVCDAVYKARLVLLEAQPEDGSDYEFAKMVTEYRKVSRLAGSRELREVAAFKNALALYFCGKEGESIDAFEIFCKNFSAGELIPEAEAFLREKLPPMIERMSGEERDFEAVLLLDKHRDILLSKQKDSTFLIRLADSLTRLGLGRRAAKIYLFLGDQYKGREEEKVFYLPLVHSYMDRLEFSAAADFSGRYLSNFPQGEDWQEHFYLHMLALQKAGRLDDAITVWQENRQRAEKKVRIVAARVFWEKMSYKDVIDCLQEGPAGIGKYPGDILLLKAESCLKENRNQEAFALYRELSAHERFSSQALYRCAEIAFSMGKKKEAVNYLHQIVEKGSSGIWSDLARTSILEMKM